MNTAALTLVTATLALLLFPACSDRRAAPQAQAMESSKVIGVPPAPPQPEPAPGAAVPPGHRGVRQAGRDRRHAAARPGRRYRDGGRPRLAEVGSDRRAEGPGAREDREFRRGARGVA